MWENNFALFIKLRHISGISTPSNSEKIIYKISCSFKKGKEKEDEENIYVTRKIK